MRMSHITVKKENSMNLVQLLLIIAIVFCTFSEGLKQLLFGIPVVHLGNAIIFALFIYVLVRLFILNTYSETKYTINKDTKVISILALLFILWGTVGAVIYKTSFFLYIWSLRNYGRFFALTFICAIVADSKLIKLLYKMLNIVIVIHIVVTLIQFFILGVRWDYLNGIFGTSMGGNSGVNALFMVNACVCLYKLYCKEISLKLFILHLIWMSGNAAISEIKIFFAEIIILIIVYFVITKDYKNILIINGFTIGIVFVGVLILGYLYPYTINDLLTKGLLYRLQIPHHDNMDSVGRTTQITGLTQYIASYASNVNGKFGKLYLFTGLGLGSAEYGTREIFNSDFYYVNQRTWYFDFILSFLYIETGIVGIITYCSMWIYIGATGLYRFIKNGDHCYMLWILAAVALGMITFYDITLRNNYGYMLWVYVGIVQFSTESKFRRLYKSYF